MYVAPPAHKSLMQKAYAGAQEEKEAAQQMQQQQRVPHPPATAASAAAAGRVKQRGIYSEFLGKSTPLAEQEVTNGPHVDAAAASAASAAPVRPAAAAPAAGAPLVQKAPKASSFKRNLAQSQPTAASLASSAALAASLAAATSATSATSAALASLPRLEPKVLVPYEQRPGKPPRRIEIERKKRLYAAQDIEKLLLAAGVNYARYGVGMDHATGGVSYLPLEIFDNVDFETHAPKEWIELGRNELALANPALLGTPQLAAMPVSIPAKALRFEDPTNPSSGGGNYVEAEVLGFDDSEEKFLVRYKDTPSLPPVLLHRIHIYFEAESPFDYVRRIVFAHATRRQLESSIRYSLYVDNMPTDEIQPLDNEQVNRILLLALSTKKLKQCALDTTSLLNEVNIDYGRTMNKIIFDVNLKDPQQHALRQQLQLTAQGGKDEDGVAAAAALVASSNGSAGRSGRYQYLGVVRVPFHDFPKHFSNFCFHSFYTKLEAITALVKVNAECLRLAKLSVFNTAISKSVRLEEFEQLQTSSMLQLSTFLKDKWIQSLKAAIKNSLREVGKGWLNLHEKNREVYLYSKLFKFMKMVSFQMEDALRFLVEESLNNYASFLARAARFKVAVIDTNEVKVTPLVDETQANEQQAEEPKDAAAVLAGAEASEANKPRDFALFNVDLVLKEGVVQYTTAPALFQSVPLALFDKALLSLQDIPQLETHVMEHLFWYGNESKLVSVQREETHVSSIYDGIASRLSAAVQPMQEYLEKFSKYADFLALNTEQYVSEFAALDNDLGDIRKEISQQVAQKERMEAEIPKSVSLGFVTVNCEDVRRKLSAKCGEIVQKELDYFARLTKARCEDIHKAFKKIEAELRKSPADIQELTKLKEFMATVPAAVSNFRDPISEAMDSFDLLESFHYRLGKDALLKLKWQTFGWPKQIHDLLESKEVALAGDKNTFLQEMRAQQEEFMVELLEVEKRVNTFGQIVLPQSGDQDAVAKIAEKCVKIQEKLEDLQTRARNFNNNEMLFGLQSTDYRHVTKVVKNFEPYFQLWTTAADWLRNHQSWLHDSFLDLNGDTIATNVATYNKAMSKCIKSKAIKDNPGCMTIATSIKKEIEQFRPLLPLIIALRNPGMRERHWDLLSEKLPFPFKPGEDMTLTRVLDDFKLQNYLEVISKVGDSAGKEYQIESSLEKMEAVWAGKREKGQPDLPIQFDIQAYKKTNTFVVRNVDEIINLLDENTVTTQAMTFSPFKKVFEERIERWLKKLNLVSEVIEEWLAVQRQWISLQAIFQSPDINKQLPAEGKRFASVNKTWRLIMSQVQANPDVLSFGDNPSLLQKLQDSNKLLQMVQKRLSDYLDKKRAAFARFYFLSNDELLAILSQASSSDACAAIQPHLKKIFENINRIEYDANNVITAMFSAEEERIDFVKPINPMSAAQAGKKEARPVEHWLTEVEQGMKETVKARMIAAVADYPKKQRKDWVRQHPGQCVLNGSQVHWTAEVEAALRDGGTKGVERYYRKWCSSLSSMVELVRGDLSPVESLVMGALIVLDVHARDVIEKLLTERCASVSDFTWIAQMRYYLDDPESAAASSAASPFGAGHGHGPLWVQMVQSRFPYSWEYLGNTLRLVITPLTDRCYLTLMTALELHLGGAPAGPAGTGKTETTKDLAKAVAKQCVVFNCSDGLNYLAMGKFFKGLASSGAWACFDEFNRIDIEVLSVVAQQIQTIWDAIREGAKTFIFEETEIKLEPTCSVFITMNPGYAGRTELPDNLQALFRPVAMMVPDYGLIGQIMLYSFGFERALPLSRKMVATFKLCSEQLSAQDHYDYGMRAVKTVITRAGILKKEFPHEDEDVLLLRALNDVNLPKFLKPDLPLFAGIISDLFPTTRPPEIDYGVLLNSLILTCKEDGLQPEDAFLDKCIQLYDTTVVRHGVMLVGPAGGGKSSNIRTLQKAMTRLRSLPAFARVKTHTLNPKAVTQDQLYGASDPYSNEWSDGTLAQIVRDCISDDTRSKNWVVFDGPVDALWIENMNTVLDDNKKLCLVSGEILQLTPYMTMFFEVEDLAVASPATVSRCGMVYMEPHGLIRPMVKSWMERMHKQYEGLRKPLQLYFDLLLEPSIQFVRKQCAEPVPSVDNNLAASLLRILESVLAPFVPIEGVARTEEQENTLAQILAHVEPIFIMALVWSVGATTDRDGRRKFSTFLRLLLEESGLRDSPPAPGLVYDYLYDYSGTQRWIPWMDSQQAYKFDDRLSYQELIIPTQDTLRYTFFIDLLVKQARHVLVTGATGTGKTTNVYQYLSSLPNDLTPLNITFSAATTANQTEDMLFGPMVKRRQRVFGPTLGKRFVIFVDDMNMPKREKYGAQPPIELLRQWMDYGGWYDRRSLQFVEIVDVSFIGAQGPPGGGRNPVSARFLRHFNQLAHTDLEPESLTAIFDTIVTNSLGKFTDDVKELSKPIVQATIHVYQRVSAGLLPTPSKSHYTFNLRDLSKVFQGMLIASPRRIATVPQFMRLWVHEARRVFQDRLINEQDRTWFDVLLGQTLHSYFNIDFAAIMPPHVLLFSDVMDAGSGEQKVYDELTDPEKAVHIMNEMLTDYNDEAGGAGMKLVLFKDAVEHVSRISRILRQPGGNALLLGVGGSGRQSLTKLAAFMAECELFQITVTKSYGATEFHDDLRKLLLDAGLKEQPTVFLLNADTQMVKESFWDDVNNILNSGEVPNLFNAEDQDAIFATCKIDCQRKNIPATKLNAHAQFLGRVKTHLHVVLCMSPMASAFRTRLRMYPALVNCTTIDWFSDWSSEGLNLVATTALTEEELQLPNIPAVVHVMQQMHRSVGEKSIEYREQLRRYNYVTPTSYLELLNVFKFLLSEKRAEVGGLRSKLQFGLDTLASASEDIARLQVDLREKEPRLVETQKEVEVTMAAIAVDKADAAVTKEQVEQQEADAAAKAAECGAIRDDAQSELDKALPMLDAAVKCLSELNKAHIDEVRNFKKPPAGVVLTMEAACILLRPKLKFKIIMKADASGMKTIPDYWQTAQQSLLKNPKLLLESLQHYDRDNIPDKVLEQLKPYIAREDFSVKKVEQASVACRAICMFCHAMYQYAQIAKLVAPKRLRLKAAEDELEKVMVTLNEARETMRQVEERLLSLTDKFDSLVAESESLKHGVAQCQVKLERANKLIGGLGGEKVRWETTVAKLDITYNNLVGDVLVAAASIAYLGAFTADYRQALTAQWRARLSESTLAHTEGCNIRSTLGDVVQIRAWNLAGLPSDELSTENGIMMSKSRRWPLMIDPQGQAAKFVKRLGAQKFEAGMDVVKLSDKGFLQSFENAVRFGKWLLLEDVQETLDPALQPLLLQQIVNVKGVPHIKLGDVQVPYNDQFHLYISTKLPNPHYAPELQVVVSLLNFTITPSGLQDQMLGTVVAKESPELEQKKNALVVQNARMKKQLQDTEDNILRLLTSATGDILDDEELINTLADSKKVSEEIVERVSESEAIEQEIDQARRAYTPVATRAQILYFTIADLALIDPMYQYSLSWFVQLFVQTVGAAPQSTDQAERLRTLVDYFTRALYENICRSLFESHKLLFSVLVARNIMGGAGKIDDGEWRHLVAGSAPIKQLANPAPEWLTENVWAAVLSLSDVPTFAGFEADFLLHLPHWKRYFDSAAPEREPLTPSWESKLTRFQRLLVLRALRPDKMTPALQEFVSAELGAEFTEAPQFSLASSYKDSTPLTPLIFILSKGADPAGKLFAFANEMGFRDRFQSISLGQGQGAIAQRYIEDGVRKGSWVLLQNCHLALSWLPALERILLELNPENVHDDFRLFLTSEPTPGFPVSILQSGVKMTNEPPKGLRANLTRSYLGFTDAQLNKSKKPREFKKLLYALCFFHAVVLDRRQFGPLGFAIPYQFTENDLNVCVTQLRDFLDLYDELPLRTLHFLTYDINYGGRVTDDVDRRTLSTILDDFMTAEVLSNDYVMAGHYTSIPTGTREHYLKHIASMDANPEPEVFGLHANASITSAQEDTNVLFQTILALLPRSSAGAGKSREQTLSESAASILERLPQPWEVESVQKKYPTDYAESFNTVVVQEVIRYNRLLVTVRATLEDLIKALKGELVMSDELEALAASLFTNQVPDAWAAVAYPSLMPLAAWVADLLARVQFIEHWIQHGIPVVFWISGFFFPQAFLTGTLQNYARKYKKPIDSIAFSVHVLGDRKADSITERPRDGIYVHGLFLEGARWDAAAQSLAESRPKELFTPFPVMWMLPEEEKQAEPAAAAAAATEQQTLATTAAVPSVYKCPVYKILTRRGTLSTTGHSTNFVIFVNLPTKAPPSKWIKASVALFCALRY